MQDIEKAGVFYVGKEYNLDSGTLQENPILFKSSNLTTHAAIIGMTGSGKTGLGVGLIEEAALDNIPVIVIDPKGDMGNLALTFPMLRGEDFLPWINLTEAANQGIAPEEYAAKQADLWRTKLIEWGQDPSRIEKFQRAAEVTVYTPGGSAGRGVSVLQSFQAPTQEAKKDLDAYREQIHLTATSLLTLVGWNEDPFTSREHILISTILEHNWDAGHNLGLPELITAIQTPPVVQVGVLDLESFYPSKDRFELAMKFNNLLASPSFKVWQEGEPLDINRFLYNESGKPRVSIFTIAHLSDKERMFFVTMLLNEILAWVRSQPGTSSLRAILYMDELYGYLPPTENPPSKKPLLTLLKQARAYGLGLVLSTQNPVDLDYKALSNAGTWFIGRLQTEQDKERVLAGLEGASGENSQEKFNRGNTEKVLSALGKRVFYLHSVHEEEPVIFQTRWALSYLAGPLTREQIGALPGQGLPKGTAPLEETDAGQMSVHAGAAQNPVAEEAPGQPAIKGPAPVLGQRIKQVFLPASGGGSAEIVYEPAVIGLADVLYNSAKHGVTVSKTYALVTPIQDGPVPLDWTDSSMLELTPKDLTDKPVENASFKEYPAAAAEAKNYENWEKLFNQHLRTVISLQLFSSPSFKLVSELGEDERAFRIRLQHLAHELRDEEVDTLKRKYETKLDVLENRQRRARQVLENRSTQANQKKMEAAVSAGTALLGALFGRKSISATSISRVGTAVKSTSRALKSGEAISQSQETLQSVEDQLAELELEMEEQIEKISQKYDVTDEKLEMVEIRPTAGNITVRLVALAWVPRQ